MFESAVASYDEDEGEEHDQEVEKRRRIQKKKRMKGMKERRRSHQDLLLLPSASAWTLRIRKPLL